MLATATIRYLNLSGEKIASFEKYSNMYWVEHFVFNEYWTGDFLKEEASTLFDAQPAGHWYKSFRNEPRNPDQTSDSREPDQDGPVACLAAWTRYEPLTRLMIMLGKPIDVHKEKCPAPLWWAAREGWVGTVELLLEAGAATESEALYPITFPLLEAAGRGHSEVVTLLLTKKAQINATSPDKTVPLYTAALSGPLALIELLIDHGASVNGHHRTEPSNSYHTRNPIEGSHRPLSAAV